MPWPVHPNGLLGAQGDNDTYRIERSLRFNSADSAYLNRTPNSASNQKTYTFNFWVKRSSFGSSIQVFSALFATTSLRYAYIGFEADDTLSFFSGIYSTGASTTTSYNYRTTQVFRDPSAWYMITASVDTTNATASDRVKIYINGSRVTSFSTSTQPSLNQDGYFNSVQYHGIGTFNGSSGMFPGYLAEINFVDGQALTPSSFGETDSITGRWKAKAYSGTYGTNGFYLKFSDNSALTTTTNVGIGKDFSGNGNYWATNGISITPGAGNDSLVDSPTNYGTDTGVGGEVRGNYCTWNPIVSGDTAANGNLDVTNDTARGNQELMKYNAYWEVTSTGGTCLAGIISTSATSTVTVGSAKTFGFKLSQGGVFEYANVTDGSSFTSQATATIPPIVYASTGGGITASLNAGQRPFVATAPSGFKALCTTNLQTPSIKNPSTAMDVVTYTGTGASNSISSLNFSPDLVWIKNRGTTTNHAIYDTTRGSQIQLSSNTTGDEITSSTGITSFDANGFTVGTSTLVNTSGTQYVAWLWDKSAVSGFDIVAYTGNGSNRNISHNLGVAPKMIIVKARTTTGADQGWPVWHTSISNTTYLTLSTTSATATGTDYWNSTSPTSSVFSVGTNAAVNLNNDTYIAYCFSEIESYSKFGSYTGNGSSDGPFVWCGFRPKWVMIKLANSIDSWVIHDTNRNPNNPMNLHLYPNSPIPEYTAGSTFYLDFVSNGLKIRSNDVMFNGLNNTYIFAAFAEAPFKYARAR
jgi:hypothetical protein